MATQARTPKRDPFTQPFAGLTDLIVVAAMSQANEPATSRINAHAAAYTVMIEKIKNDTRERNLMALPQSAKRLYQDNQIIHPRFYAAAQQLEAIEKIEYDDKGRTKPASRKSLDAEAMRRRANHSSTLTTNMLAAQIPKPSGEVDAHHIVSARSKNAYASRNLLYGWGIGINDVDNGVFLPRNRKVTVVDPSLKNAVKHSVVHTRLYHLSVFNELKQAHINDCAGGRDRLRGIRLDLIDGTFPYRKGDEQ